MACHQGAAHHRVEMDVDGQTLGGGVGEPVCQGNFS